MKSPRKRKKDRKSQERNIRKIFQISNVIFRNKNYIILNSPKIMIHDPLLWNREMKISEKLLFIKS